MIFRTHLAFGLLLGLLLVDKFNLDKWLFLLLILLGSALPDIDHPKSKIGKNFGFLSKIINFIFGHRKWIHSIFFLIVLSFLIRSLFNDLWIPFFIGYFSHLFIDGFTLNGINFIYPLKQLRLQGFIETGNKWETILFLIFAFFDLLLLYIVFF